MGGPGKGLKRPPPPTPQWGGSMPSTQLQAHDGSHTGNAMHAVRTQCKVLDVDKYSNPSFGPFSQVFGSVPGFF